MNDLSRSETQGVPPGEQFDPLSADKERGTDAGEKQETLPDSNGKNIYGIASDLVSAIEKRFATATFALIIIGYIVIASFGKTDVNLPQYMEVIGIGFIFYVVLKFPKNIIFWVGKFIKYPLYYIPLVLILFLLLLAYFIYGKPVVYFHKDYHSNNCQSLDLFIKEAR